MKTHKICLWLGVSVALWFLAASSALATDQVLAVGGRFHQKQSASPDLPFGDGDIGYGLAYEFHDADAFWQLAAEWTPSLKDNDVVDYAITPQLNLLLKDKMFQGGLGILSTYTKGAQEDDWTDLYWQFLLGLSIPLPGPLKVEVNACYPFQKWDKLDDFKFEDVEYGVWIGYQF